MLLVECTWSMLLVSKSLWTWNMSIYNVGNPVCLHISMNCNCKFLCIIQWVTSILHLFFFCVFFSKAQLMWLLCVWLLCASFCASLCCSITRLLRTRLWASLRNVKLQASDIYCRWHRIFITLLGTQPLYQYGGIWTTCVTLCSCSSTHKSIHSFKLGWQLFLLLARI